jgi:hypothetical protein
MARETTHYLLHLTGSSLGWLRLRRTGRTIEVVDRGRSEGDGDALLDTWAEKHADAGASVRLYDGRPRYYCFRMTTPMLARRQQTGAVALKVRQELGVSADQLTWAARAGRSATQPDRVEFFTVVARRDDFEPIRRWAERRRFASLWVGADVDAVHYLVHCAGLPRPLAVLNCDAGGVTVFHADEEGGLAKGRLATAAEANGSLPAALAGDRRPNLGRICFGDPDWSWLGRVAPALELLPERKPSPPDARATKPALQLRNGSTTGGVTDDAVLLGGLYDLIDRHCSPSWLRLAPAGTATAMASLLHVAGAPSAVAAPWERLESRLPGTRRLVKFAAIAALALVVAVSWLVVARGNGQGALRQHVAGLRDSADILRSQQTVLQTIGGERKPLIPVIQTIHQAAPEGMLVDTLQIGNEGQMQIGGKIGDPKLAGDFFNALSGSPLLTEVRLPVVKPGDDGMTFEMTGRIAARQTARRR